MNVSVSNIQTLEPTPSFNPIGCLPGSSVRKHSLLGTRLVVTLAHLARHHVGSLRTRTTLLVKQEALSWTRNLTLRGFEYELRQSLFVALGLQSWGFVLGSLNQRLLKLG